MKILKIIFLDDICTISIFALCFFLVNLPYHIFIENYRNLIITGGLALISLFIFIWRFYQSKRILESELTVKANVKILRVGYTGNCSVEIFFNLNDIYVKRKMNLQRGCINQDQRVLLKVDPANYSNFRALPAEGLTTKENETGTHDKHKDD